jgi:hypothetical protein
METALIAEEREAGCGIELLKRAASNLDLDGALAWLYISHLLAPTGPLPANTPSGSARTRLNGKHRVPYFDQSLGREIGTQIFTAPWQIMLHQQPLQPSLLPEVVAPVPVDLAASRAWTALTTSNGASEDLPLGEVIGAIEPSQTGGAWARSLAIASFHWCACNLSAALEGRHIPSRAMLSQFPPKKAPLEEILRARNPFRAIDYWNKAESILSEAKRIELLPTVLPVKKPRGW